MAIAFDAASNSGIQTGSSFNWSHTFAGADLFGVVGVSILSVLGGMVSTVTVDGTPMTLIGAKTTVLANMRAELWGLIAPGTGTKTVEVTLNTALGSRAGAVSLTGVHQTTPTEDFASNDGTDTMNPQTASVTVTTGTDNDWIIDCVATDDGSITVGAGQDERSNVTGMLGSGAMSTFGPKTQAGARAMTWTGIAALKTWVTVGTGIRPATADQAIRSRMLHAHQRKRRFGRFR